MSGYRFSNTIAACFGAMILLGACSGEPSEVVIGVSNDAGDASAAADDKAGTVADDSAPVETTTTTGPASTTTTEPSQTTVLAAPATKLEILGPTMIGIGDWATIRPVNAPETDCDNKTLLAYVVDGVIVHRYDELGGFGGVRLFNGLKGQDAFVINCEESIERVLLQGSAVVPQSGWPELTDIRFYGEDAPDAIFDFGSDFGWRGDIFAAYGYSSAGDELFMFDAAEGTVEPVFARIGERSQVSNVHGIDVVVPTGWVLEDEASVSHPESFSRVQVTRLDGTRDDPLAEGDEFLSSDSVDIRLWSTPDAAGNARRASSVTATDWMFLAPDGIRVVRQIPIDGATIEIEMFVDDVDGAPGRDLPWLLLELARVVSA